MGFGVLFDHPTVVSVLLSALVEKYFVSRMRDFFLYVCNVEIFDREPKKTFGAFESVP